MSWRYALRTRREFLAGLAWGAAAALPRNSTYNPELVAHTFVWTTRFPEKRPAALLEECLMGTRRAGYRRVEMARVFVEPECRERAIALLRRTGLEPEVIDAAGPLHDRDAAEATRRRVLETARIMLGASARYVSFTAAARSDGRAKTDAELDSQAYQLNRLGDLLRNADLGLLLDHGPEEMRDGAREWRHALGHTEKALLNISLDVEWAMRAGLDPAALVGEAGTRLGAVHVRNCRKGIRQERVGEGDIDLSALARALRQIFYDGLLVVDLRYDPQTRPLRSLATDLSLSRAYMQEVFGTRPGARPVDMGPHVRVKA